MSPLNLKIHQKVRPLYSTLNGTKTNFPGSMKVSLSKPKYSSTIFKACTPIDPSIWQMLQKQTRLVSVRQNHCSNSSTSSPILKLNRGWRLRNKIFRLTGRSGEMETVSIVHSLLATSKWHSPTIRPSSSSSCYSSSPNLKTSFSQTAKSISTKNSTPNNVHIF